MASDERAERRKRAELAKEISGKLLGTALGKGEERISEGRSKESLGVSRPLTINHKRASNDAGPSYQNNCGNGGDCGE